MKEDINTAVHNLWAMHYTDKTSEEDFTREFWRIVLLIFEPTLDKIVAVYNGKRVTKNDSEGLDLCAVIADDFRISLESLQHAAKKEGTIKRITRRTFLTDERAAENERITALVKKEFPPLKKGKRKK